MMKLRNLSIYKFKIAILTTISLFTLFEIKCQSSLENKIQVVAHRGDWRNAPENSLKAIESAIKIGVDIVEIDFRVTKDEKLILMHDEWIDRTTSGKGKVKDYLLNDLKKFNLKNGSGSWTSSKIPTLKEALLVAKNRVKVNIDLKDKTQLLSIIELVDFLDMTNEVIFKIYGDLKIAKKLFGNQLEKITFMPIINVDDKNSLIIVDEYLSSSINIYAFELIVKNVSNKFKVIKEKINDKNKKIWINALWSEMCAGNNDEKAFDDINVYQWFVDNHIDIIQTDRPTLLIGFLKTNQKH